MTKRIIADVILFLLALSGPYWLLCIIGLCFLALFDSYIEIMFAGFVVDMMFRNSLETFPYLTIISFVALILSMIIKKRIRNF